MTAKKVCENIKVYLVRNDISQKSISIAVDVSASKLSQILRGNARMSLELYIKICDALKLPYTYFFKE